MNLESLKCSENDLTALVLDAPVWVVCLSMQVENICKCPLGLIRFHSRKWINDITRAAE